MKPRSAARASVRLSTLRGSATAGSPSGVVMSQNMRAVGSMSPRHGSVWKVVGSGYASRSDSNVRLSPSIAEPSKPMPSVNAPSTSAGAIATDFRVPTTSVNQSLTNLTLAPRWSGERSRAAYPSTPSLALSAYWLGERRSAEPGCRCARMRHVRAAHERRSVRDSNSASATARQNPYGGAAASGGPKRVRTRHFQNAKREGIKITGLTSYDSSRRASSTRRASTSCSATRRATTCSATRPRCRSRSTS